MGHGWLIHLPMSHALVSNLSTGSSIAACPMTSSTSYSGLPSRSSGGGSRKFGPYLSVCL
jgi:hypothetical protein